MSRIPPRKDDETDVAKLNMLSKSIYNLGNNSILDKLNDQRSILNSASSFSTMLDKINAPRSILNPASSFSLTLDKLNDQNSVLNSASSISSVLEKLNAQNSVFNSVSGMSLMLEKLNDQNNIFSSTSSISSMLEKLNAQNSVFNSVSGISLMLEKLNDQNSVFNSTSSISSMLEKLNDQNSVFNSTSSISSVLEKLNDQNSVFNSTSSISSVLEKLNDQNSVFNSTSSIGSMLEKLNAQNSVFNSVSGMNKMLAELTDQKEIFNIVKDINELIDDRQNTIGYNYKHVKAVEFAETTSDNLSIDIHQIKTLLIELDERLSRINKTSIANFLATWMTIVGFIIMLYQWNQKILDESNPEKSIATKEQIEQLKDKLNKTFQESINKYTVEKAVTLNCNIFRKPSLRTIILLSIKKGQKLSVINTNKKWAMVVCLDRDSLPVTGWVLKKYLSKIKD